MNGDPAPAESTESDDPSYADAVAELEQILRELEDEAVDVDHLVARVRRASLLLRVCRRRIDDAQVEIEHIVAELGDGLGEP